MYGCFKNWIRDNIEIVLLWRESAKLPVCVTKADIPCLLTGCSARSADGLHWMDDDKWINPTTGKHSFMSRLHNPFAEAFTREKILSGWAKVRCGSCVVRDVCASVRAMWSVRSVRCVRASVRAVRCGAGRAGLAVRAVWYASIVMASIVMA